MSRAVIRRWVLVAAWLAVASTGWALEPGQRAPEFQLPGIANPASIHLADFRGKVVLVDFWASWCGPCRQSLPLYNGLRRDFSDNDFVILAVNLDEESADAKAFLRQHPVDYTTVQDPQGEVAKAFALTGMPESFLIDRSGFVRHRHIGFAPRDIAALKREIAALIAPTAHAN